MAITRLSFCRSDIDTVSSIHRLEFLNLRGGKSLFFAVPDEEMLLLRLILLCPILIERVHGQHDIG